MTANWRRVAVAVVGVAVVVVALFLYLDVFWAEAWAAAAAGVFAGVSGTLLVTTVSAESGGMIRRQGADSEAFVHEALSSLRKKGWQVRSAVTFADGDVDHVVIGCDRIVVVETKYSHANWRLTADGLWMSSCDPLAQVRRNLGRVQRLLTGGRSGDLPGEALLVMRGPAAAQLGDCIERRQGVAIMNLAGLDRFVQGLAAVEERSEAAALAARVDEYLAKRRNHQQRCPAPVPR